MQPGREVGRHEDMAQRYAFLGKNEVEVSDVVITVPILVCKWMPNVSFDPGFYLFLCICVIFLRV